MSLYYRHKLDATVRVANTIVDPVKMKYDENSKRTSGIEELTSSKRNTHTHNDKANTLYTMSRSDFFLLTLPLSSETVGEEQFFVSCNSFPTSFHMPIALCLLHFYSVFVLFLLFNSIDLFLNGLKYSTTLFQRIFRILCVCVCVVFFISSSNAIECMPQLFDGRNLMSLCKSSSIHLRCVGNSDITFSR